jgi:hypothetical protein
MRAANPIHPMSDSGTMMLGGTTRVSAPLPEVPSYNINTGPPVL